MSKQIKNLTISYFGQWRIFLSASFHLLELLKRFNDSHTQYYVGGKGGLTLLVN